MNKVLRLIITVIVLVLVSIDTQAETLRGDATYYGSRWHGRRTSSGEIYNKDSLTCAHRTLPFGTQLTVTNTKNGKSVVVRVTDRGPFRKGAIVDLSLAAAKAIGMIRDGVVPVLADVMRHPMSAPDDEPVRIPELQLLDLKTGKYYSAADYASARMEERAAHLRTAKIQAKENMPYRILMPQMQIAQAKKAKDSKNK